MENEGTSWITTQLKQIERENEVEIMFAVESGSRVQGFASETSDYDVRFIYKKKINWYLCIDEGLSDVIEKKGIKYESFEADFAGWDLKKALKMLREGNPPINEWLRTPSAHMYIENTEFINKCLILSDIASSNRQQCFHFLNIAKKHVKMYFIKNGNPVETVILKKYFYIVRPLLSILWVKQFSTQISPADKVPMLLPDLCEIVEFESEIKNIIKDLLYKKQNEPNFGEGKTIKVLDDWINSTIKWSTNYCFDILKQGNLPKTEKFNEFLISQILE